ncbi:MAG: helix-turn-helix domain-containing protein [Armatimonadetes bacterium]|nr:helix-turn-helix domain-containing protein [Armatimonadota bacterium]
MHNVYVEVGRRIRESRLRLGLTQEKLAGRVHSTPSYIARIERGARKPTLEFLGKVAEALGVSLGSLFSHEPVQPNCSLALEIQRILNIQPEPVQHLSIQLIRLLVETVSRWQLPAELPLAAEAKSSYLSRPLRRGPYRKKRREPKA